MGCGPPSIAPPLDNEWQSSIVLNYIDAFSELDSNLTLQHSIVEFELRYLVKLENIIYHLI